MMRRPKTKNKVKLKALQRGVMTVKAAAAAVGVHCSTWKLYLEHHLDNPFSTSTSEKRALISRFVVKAWEAVKPDTILKGFARAGVVPTGPHDRDGRFREAVILADALLVQDG
ncbi:hypothetical protein PF001_g1316 [Phytophthora fragariae]|uniref:DDE-1 domain-containing protein n=2 Tax=Phytophthora fragariae TaxID=53985 RepID=A0A6A4EWH8_9STRA|nr:hypothetical protein PF006_g6690 [Phytophthora fragariae]KAE9328583.1 hypothetical protein PF001_g1316 [Phytophthora fragariae]